MSEDLINVKSIDRFSFVHFGAGFLLGKTGISPIFGVLIGSLWEFVEPELKLSYPEIFPHPVADSTANKIFDVLFFTLGFELAR